MFADANDLPLMILLAPRPAIPPVPAHEMSDAPVVAVKTELCSPEEACSEDLAILNMLPRDTRRTPIRSRAANHPMRNDFRSPEDCACRAGGGDGGVVVDASHRVAVLSFTGVIVRKWSWARGSGRAACSAVQAAVSPRRRFRPPSNRWCRRGTEVVVRFAR